MTGLKRGIATVLITSGLAAPAAAQDASNLQSMVFLSGTCDRLVVAGRDATAACRGMVLNLNYRTGRTSFAFTEGENRMVSFSGMGTQAEGDVARHDLDLVTIAEGPQAAVTSEAATGACAYSNPYAGRSYVRCTAHTEAGEYSAAFTSDGRPPDVTRFPDPPAN